MVKVSEASSSHHHQGERNGKQSNLKGKTQEQRHSEKMTILNLIFKDRDILFGPLSDKLTFFDKKNKWDQVADTAKSLGIYDKNGEYLRNTTWQNWRRPAMEKRDKRKKTGTSGGKGQILTEADHLVFDIIGSDAVMDGARDVPDFDPVDGNDRHITLDDEQSSSPKPNNGSKDPEKEEDEEGGSSSSDTREANTRPSTKPARVLASGKDEEKITRPTTSNAGKGEDKPTRPTMFRTHLEAKRKVMEEESEIRVKKKKLLDLESMKRKMEIYEMERKLGLPPCPETKELHERAAAAAAAEFYVLDTSTTSEEN